MCDKAYVCITLFNNGESSVELKVNTKNTLQLFYLIAVWESDMSDTFLRSRLKCPIEQAFFKSWGKFGQREFPLKTSQVIISIE